MPRKARALGLAIAGLLTVPGLAAADRAADLASLRAGVQAFQAGDYQRTIELLSPIEQQPWHNRGIFESLLGQSYFLTDHFDKALPYFQRAHADVGRWRAADTLFELGRDAEAKKAYEKLLADKTGDGEPAVALARLATLAERAGKPKEAAAQLRRLYLELPAHPLALKVPAELGRLGQAATFKPAERIRRAQLLTEARQWDRAMLELAAVPAGVSADVKDQLDYWTGETLFKMRRQYGRAGQLLLAVAPRMGARSLEAWFHGAQALSRADRDEEAIKQYAALVKAHPDSEHAPEAQYKSGWLEYTRGRYAEAIPGLEGVLAKYPKSKDATNAEWFLGFARWMLGKPAEALPIFEKLAARGGELTGGKGRYWKAKCLAALGKDAEAVATWRSIPASWPLSYYAQLARMQLRERKIEVGPFGDKPPAAKGPALEPPGTVPPAAAKDDDLARVDELLDAGLLTEAAEELRRAEGAILKRYGAKAGLRVLFDRYHKADNYNRPYQLGESHDGGALDTPPEGDARPWWEITHPEAYKALVEKYQDLGKNPPYYLYTIMKKESGYNAHDTSYADALGLLQMIPPTTRRVAKVLGMEYSDDLLYDPEGNIKTGSWYIGHLVQKFRGQIPLGAGAFNAGPARMMKWVDRSGKRPFDEFVELVTFEQSREYIKKVVGIYSRYLLLYAKQDFQLSPTVNADYLKDDGISY